MAPEGEDLFPPKPGELFGGIRRKLKLALGEGLSASGLVVESSWLIPRSTDSTKESPPGAVAGAGAGAGGSDPDIRW